MMTMINSLWLLFAVARSISTVDKEVECYCLGPTAASLSASLALSLSLSLHTSFTAHSLAFCGESVCQSVCVREVAPSVLFKGPNNGVSQPVPPQRGQLWRSWNKEEPSEMFTCSPQGSLSWKTSTVALCWPLYRGYVVFRHPQVSQRPVLAVWQECSCRPTSLTSLRGLAVVILIRRRRGRDLTI